MAEHESTTKTTNDKTNHKQHFRQQDSKPLFEQFHAWDQNLLSLTETPFSPQMDEHAAILSSIPSSVQRHTFIMRLHQVYGNSYVQRLVKSVEAQAKLTVNAPNDIYEQEADRVTESVTKAINSRIQPQAKQEEEEEEESVQMSVSHLQRQEISEEEEVRNATADALTNKLGPSAAYTKIIPILPVNPPFATATQVARFIRGEEENKAPEKKNKAEEKKPSTSNKAKLESILKKVDDMIRTARKIPEGKYAADNLEYWKSKKGGTKKMPASAFSNQNFIIEWLRGNPRTKFILGAETRLKEGELVSGGTAKMHWEQTIYTPEGHPLFYALGNFTIYSDVIVKATAFPPKEGGGYLISFVSWTCHAIDKYDWDKMKSTIIPLYGEISDDDLRVLEKYGYGKSFDVKSEYWTVTDSQCLQEVAIEE